MAQNTEGWWDATRCARASPRVAFTWAHRNDFLCSTTASALEARPASETEKVKETLLSRLAAAFGAVAEAGLELDDDGGDNDRDDDRRENNAVEDLFTAMRGAALPRSNSSVGARTLDRAESSRVLRRTESLVAAAQITDCPLTCSEAAIVDATPRRLVALQAADGGINASRIWATLCCISVLERMNVS